MNQAGVKSPLASLQFPLLLHTPHLFLIHLPDIFLPCQPHHHPPPLCVSRPYNIPNLVVLVFGFSARSAITFIFPRMEQQQQRWWHQHRVVQSSSSTRISFQPSSSKQRPCPMRCWSTHSRSLIKAMVFILRLSTPQSEGDR